MGVYSCPPFALLSSAFAFAAAVAFFTLSAQGIPRLSAISSGEKTRKRTAFQKETRPGLIPSAKHIAPLRAERVAPLMCPKHQVEC